MKCMLDEAEVFTLSETQQKVLGHVMEKEKIPLHVAELLKWAVGKSLQECAIKLFREWKPKLAQEGVESVPLADEKLAELIFNHKDYSPNLETKPQDTNQSVADQSVANDQPAIEDLFEE